MTMMLRFTQDVLRHYPQIHLACHLAHPRARTNTFHLTDKDIVLLGHLDQDAPMLAGSLARHLGVGSPALSAQLARQLARGMIARRRAHAIAGKSSSRSPRSAPRRWPRPPSSIQGA